MSRFPCFILRSFANYWLDIFISIFYAFHSNSTFSVASIGPIAWKIKFDMSIQMVFFF